MQMEQSVPKRRHLIFIRQGITKKKAYNDFKDLYARTCILNSFSQLVKTKEIVETEQFTFRLTVIM